MGRNDAITFTVGTEDAEALTSFLRLSKAERELEVQTLKGNVAYKQRQTAQRLATQESDRASAAAAREAEALKRLEDREKARAKAALAAQKSRALQARMEEEQSRRVRMAKGWESSLARAQYEADGANHKRVMARNREIDAALANQKKGLAAVVSGAGRYAKSLGLVGAAAGAATLALSEMQAQHRFLMEEAKGSDEAARGLKEFIALQPEGEAGRAHVRETVLRGAAAGVSAEEVGAMAQPIQSVVDADGDGRLDEKEQAAFDEDFGAALQLRQVGVSAKDAQTVVTAGRARGQGGTVSADKLIAASDVSAAGPADFSRAASAMGQFKSGDAALAMTTALTKEEKNFEQLPTLVRALSLTLGEANDDSEFSKKFGLKGLGEAEKVQALRQYAVEKGDQSLSEEERIAAFSRTFKNEGLDEEKARALGIVVRQGGAVEDTMARLASVESGLTGRKVEALRADPLAGSAMRADEAKAQVAADQLYGVDSDEARDERAMALARGVQLRQYGGGRAVDPETGEEKSAGLNADPGDLFGLRSSWDVLAGRTRAMFNGMPGTGFRGGGVGYDDATGAGELERVLKEHQEALRANTEATKENTAAAGTGGGGSGRPGGAALNAEELK